MPTALIADDEPLMRESLCEQLQALWPDLQIMSLTENGPETLREIQAHRPDIAFLDIRMPGLSGLEVARAVQGSTQIVFVTAYDNHAVDAFESNAVDYVLKPVEPARLAKVVAMLQRGLQAAAGQELTALRRALQELGVAPDSNAPEMERLEWLQVAKGHQIKMTRLDDVVFFKSDEKYTEVVTTEWRGLIRLSLRQILDRSPADAFLQTHRSTIVNRRFIKAVHQVDDKMEIELEGLQDRLPVSQSNHGLFKGM